MPDDQSLKHTLELTVPAEEVASETERAIQNIKARVKLPGFRPGRVPDNIIRRRFSEEIKHDVLEKLLPKHFWERAEQEGLAVAGPPSISEVHFEPGEPLRFKAEFEVAPQFELKEYKDLTVTYSDPEVTDEDVNKRLDALRDQKAEYVSVDPRPVEKGDYAVISLHSTAGVQPPMSQDELTVEVGGEDTLAGFTDGLLGMTPGEDKDVEVAYPEDYGNARLAGKTVTFHIHLKAIRRKELPELDDEFARDVGDYQNLEELRQAVRNAIFAERQYVAQQEAKNKLVETLVDMHDFPVPEAYVERQIENLVERHLHSLAAEGVDPSKVKLDWAKIKASQRDRAIREVKASLLLQRISERENLYATEEEVDREVARIARQEREPVAATRIRLEKEQALGRIASRIRTEKTLSYLFEHARKVAQ
ncbi:MAG: trigger factor [bacterium]